VRSGACERHAVAKESEQACTDTDTGRWHSLAGRTREWRIGEFGTCPNAATDGEEGEVVADEIKA